MPSLRRPDIPDRVVGIEDFASVPGGAVKNTEAFAAAIAARVFGIEEAAIRMIGPEDAPIENILLEDLTRSTTRGVILDQAYGVTFRNGQVRTTEGPSYDLENVSDLVIDGPVLFAGESLRLR